MCPICRLCKNHVSNLQIGQHHQIGQNRGAEQKKVEGRENEQKMRESSLWVSDVIFDERVGVQEEESGRTLR